MTGEQLRALRDLLATFGHDVLLHGDAVGAEAEAHDIRLRLTGTPLVTRPSVTHGALIKWQTRSVHPSPYLVRNRDIPDCPAKYDQAGHQPNYVSLRPWRLRRRSCSLCSDSNSVRAAPIAGTRWVP